MLGYLLLTESNSLVDLVMDMRRVAVAPGGSLAGVTGVATMLAGLLALFRTFKVTTDIMSGVEVSMWDITKPFWVTVLIMNFSLVIGITDAITSACCDGINAITVDVRKDNVKCLGDYLREVSEKEKRDLEAMGLGEDDVNGTPGTVEMELNSGISAMNSSSEPDGKVVLNFFNKEEKKPFWKRLTSFASDMIGQIYGTLVKSEVVLLSQLAWWLFNVVSTIIELVAQIYLCVLAMLGPFVLALSVMPGFGSFITWIVRYVQVSFWCPIVMLINAMVQNIYHCVLNMDTSQIMSVNVGSGIGVSSLSTYVLLGGIIMLFGVGNLAGILIQSTGMNNLRDKMKSGMSSTGKAGKTMKKAMTKNPAA